MVSHRKALPAEFSWLPVRILQDSLHFDDCNHNSVVRSQHIYKHVIRNCIQRSLFSAIVHLHIFRL
ncbi:hypothetical protein V1505DRAFT_365216, partial [Lipomyces doorenjongii]